MITLFYYAIGVSLIPLIDIMFSKPKPMTRYGVYIGFWVGVWSFYLASVIIL